MTDNKNGKAFTISKNKPIIRVKLHPKKLSLNFKAAPNCYAVPNELCFAALSLSPPHLPNQFHSISNLKMTNRNFASLRSF